ncbi:response regulator [Actinoplanes sp. NEAU-H7]|uniref:Response regulator n=1 Tax=Actinoplanes flavus TaxID=2820290 RepID=A0ABS3UJZ5_9ACTN|nr:response regulator [Actinoplanes flavus]
MKPLRVLLADAAPLQRAGLRAVLTGPHGGVGTPASHGEPVGVPTPASHGRPAGTPTSAPQGEPIGASTPAPQGKPTSAPTPAQHGKPTSAPTPAPHGKPTSAPTPAQHGKPTSAPTSAPHGKPVDVPSPASPGELVGVPGLAEIVVAGETGDGAEAVDLARRLLPDVLIVDVALPRLDGLAVTRAVTEARLAVRVLVLTERDTDDEVVAAVAAGASGYLCKDTPHDELIAAVRAVAAGGAVIAPPILARVLTRLAGALPTAADGSAAARLGPLTGREREVLVHVARGRSNAEIATILGVGETTVKTHVGHVLTKLRLRDRTQAVVLAYETGLVRPGI